MAKLALICLTAAVIGFAKYIAGPVMLKGMDIDFMQSMAGAHIIPQAQPGPRQIVFRSLFPVAAGVPPAVQPAPPSGSSPRTRDRAGSMTRVFLPESYGIFLVH